MAPPKPTKTANARPRTAKRPRRGTSVGGAGARPQARRGRRAARRPPHVRRRRVGPLRAHARAGPRVYGPLYERWHRVEWEGLEHIPTDGGALLVSNHAGAIPSDAPAIMHGIETELGRPVYGLADEIFKQLPVVGTMWSRVGGVLAHPDNAYRLLREQQQLALVFPEGTKGTGKTYGERYQLRRFGRGGFVQIAMRAGVPIIPIAVVGAEEAMPILWKSPQLAKLLGLPYVPITANMFAFAGLGPLGAALPLPAKIKIQVLDAGALRRRARPAALLPQPDHGRVRAHPAADPGSALRHAPRPPLGLVRLRRDGQARPHHRPGHLLGRPGRPGPRGRPHRRRDRRPRPLRAHRAARAHRVRPQRRELLDPRPHREGREDRHDRAHLPGGRLHDDARRARSTRST